MLLKKEREAVVRFCRKMLSIGLTKGTGGNISIYCREKGLFAISPSGIEYEEMEKEDVVVLDTEGNIVQGKRKPSSECELHRILYVNRKDINAVVHAHPIYCTVLATIGEGLPASSYLVALAGKDVRCAQYAAYGTAELAENAYKSMKDRNAVFLANHGLVTGGSDILNAFEIAEQIEFCAEVYVKARSIGTPLILSDEEMERMKIKFQTYGQTEE